MKHNASKPDYLSERAAAAFCQVPRERIKRWAAEKVIGTQKLPGMPPRYIRAELEALLRNSTDPGRGLAHAG